MSHMTPGSCDCETKINAEHIFFIDNAKLCKVLQEVSLTASAGQATQSSGIIKIQKERPSDIPHQPPDSTLRSLRNLRRLRKIPKVGSVFLKVGFSQGRVVKYKGLHEIFPRRMLDIFSRSARVFSRSRRVFPRSILTFLKVGLGFLNYQLRRREAGASHRSPRCVFSGFLKTSEFQETGFPRC